MPSPKVHVDLLPPGNVWSATVEHGTRQVATEWHIIGGRPEPTSVTVTALDRTPVTASALRQLPLGEIITDCRKALAGANKSILGLLEGLGGSIDPATRSAMEPFTQEAPRRGRRLKSDDLAVVATAYRTAWLDGMPVTEAVAEACCLSRSGAAKRIMQARAAGLLEGLGPQR